MQGLGNECKVLNVVSEEVAQPDEGPNLPKGGRYRHGPEEPHLFSTRLNAVWSLEETQVGHFRIPEIAFG